MTKIDGMNKRGFQRTRIPRHIRDWIYYDADTGIMLWKQSKGIRVKKNQPIGKTQGSFTFEGKKYRCHRVAYYLATGKQPLHVCKRVKGKDDLKFTNLYVRLM